MSILNLIFAEIRFRWLNFVLSLLAVIVAATLFVIGPTLISGYAADTGEQLAVLESEADALQSETEAMKAETQKMLADMDKQTKRIMRDLGVNLRIVHQETNMSSLYTDFQAVDFPEDYVQRLAEAPSIETIVHLVATLQDKIKWNDRTVLLVGTLPVLTMSQKNEEKPHMVKNVEEGTALVGHELGAGLEKGQTIEIEGHKLTVAQIMPEYGELQDVQLVVHLRDAQKILNREGKVNQIMALNCKCKGDRLSVIRAELEGVLPDTKVTEHATRASAREQQRDLVEATRNAELAQAEANLQRIVANRDRQRESRLRQQKTLSRLVGIMTPVVVLASALFVGLMTWLNVRERRPEIGVLRALGKGTAGIAALFLGKSVLLGLLGGAAGALIGYFAAPAIGQSAMEIDLHMFTIDLRLLVATVIGAPVITVMAAYLPTLSAVAQDPAVVLMDA